MSKEIIPYVSKSIINGINTNYAKSQDAAKNAIVYAIKTGEFLLKAKAKVPHGEWVNWIEKGKSDLPFSSHVRAKSYMKLAKNKELALVVNDTDSTFNLEDINKAIANASDEDKAKVLATLSTGDAESYTPAKYIESARSVMGSIDLDPASNETAQEVVKAGEYYDIESDGLGHLWQGNVWVNPPYKQPHIMQFVEKLVDHYQNEDVNSAILLTNNSTDTQWFKLAALNASYICFTTGRIGFYKNDNSISAPTNGQCFFYFGDNDSEFLLEFKRYGIVVEIVAVG